MATPTNRKALQSIINYPLPEDSFETALVRFNLNGDSEYSSSSLKAVDLCAAWLILVVCTSGNVSEGGYSLSLGDKNALLKIRSLIISQYPDDVIDTDKPVVSAVTGKW